MIIMIFSLQANKLKSFSGPDKDYGDLCDELECVDLPISQKNVAQEKINILNSLKLSIQEIQILERSTVDQAKSDEWHKERKHRLTASNFGRVCKLRNNIPRINTIKYILYNNVFTPKTAEMT